jgi:hypothetical protein
MWHLPATIVAGCSLVTLRVCGHWLLIWLLDPATGPSWSGLRCRQRTTGRWHALRSASPTGKRTDTPRTGTWEIEDGKIKTFDCYPGEGTIIFAQPGVLAHLQAALTPAGGTRGNDRA